MVCLDATGGVLEPGTGQVHGLAGALAARGREVVIYAPRGAGADEAQPAPDGLRIAELSAGPTGGPEVPRLPEFAGEFVDQLCEAWLREPPALVHSWGWSSGLTSVLAFAEGEAPAPLVHSVMHPPGDRVAPPGAEDVWADRERIERVVAQRAARLVAMSGAERAWLARLGVPRDRVSLIPPGIDCGLFGADGPVLACRERFRLVLVGSPAHTRDAATAIQALTALPDVELVMTPASGDRAWTVTAADRFRRLARAVGVADRVRLVDGSSPGRRAALLRSADVVLCLGGSRRAGAAVLEAMACGAPVITHPRADPTEAVIDNVTGVRLGSDLPTDVALAVRELLGNAARRIGMGYAGRDRAVHRYNWPIIAAAASRVYEQVVAEAEVTAQATPPSLPG